MIDFSKYKIYIPQEKTSGTLLEPDYEPRFLEKNLIYNYKEGIEIISKEKRGLYLPLKISNMEVSMYFDKKYGVFAH